MNPFGAPPHPPSFDTDHPPDPKQAEVCVHCGFCLSTCPSYRVIGKETDSPRGRIYLMQEINAGRAKLSPETVQHFDTCLGCLACVTTCPSGVAYDQLIAATRVQIERHYSRPLPERWLRQFIFAVFPYPQRLRMLLRPLWLYQKMGLQRWVRDTKLTEKLLPRPLAAMESMLPPLSASAFRDPEPEIIPAQGDRRYRVGLILGCVQRLFLPEVNAATLRVLTANGCEVVLPPDQGCCAALSHHQGQELQTQMLAKQMIDSFSKYRLDAVLINASGCGHTLKEYGHLLQDDPEYCDRAADFAASVQDVQEFLAATELITPLFPLQATPLIIAYQDACHMLHGQQIAQQPRQLLRQIPGIELRDPIDASLCCGSAGIYNILQPDVAEELGRQKVYHLKQTRAQVIASANVGCTLQLRKHLQEADPTSMDPPPVLHPMQLLDAAIRQIDLSTLLAGYPQIKR
ncbi:(Fe-S)-binding protein [Lyngbya confervoides]|uniref:Glycolate oxidase iron-sulfur subunit n=1 Tax=Lyngbya confervoides BDU141951 TaxID=1574623 RepID=A0ABD4SZ55_9CYAN|nr:heterodisulfide reductase-related iron-sulfur binding cluster [Lyngbya confervoides]MCM1981548.1 heterodisulfide reductase-related iron-sulfur binding cluster [Lyngbya confervoides BDU141951]